MALAEALAAWTQHGRGEPLVRLLDRSLDGDGVPRAWPLGTWWPVLDLLAAARRARSDGWPETLDARAEGLFRAALRFSRPDGRALWGDAGDESSRGRLLRDWAEWVADPTLGAVVARWYPGRGSRSKPPGVPPLPAFACADRALAILRPDWSPHGNLIAVDQRLAAGPCQIALVGGGQEWFRDVWKGAEATGKARVTAWRTGAFADFLEWTFPTALGRVTRTALLLRGRDLAFLGEQVNQRGEAGLRISLGVGVRTRSIEGSRALQLVPGKGPLARVVPLALGMAPGLGASGVFQESNGVMSYRMAVAGRRAWLPLLVSWGVERARKPLRWQALTVTEKSQICPPDRAVAWRVWWSQTDCLVVYRSLGQPAARAFLGHQTKPSTRFLVAEFDEDGDFRPLLTV